LEQRWLRAACSVASKPPPEAKAIAKPKFPYVRKRTRSTFTPERLEEIRNLVALGKSREEIAGLLGVTVGTLQVTCSKLAGTIKK
jgi:DNA-binding NarL/FixJ family response regulator